MASKYSFDPYHTASSQIKTAWRRLVLKNIRYSDDYEKLDMLYTVPDPWDMTSQAEQFRFRETNRIILQQFGHQGSILEVGCGEGHHSLHLRRVCERLTGLDVSAKAVNRAKSRCPESQFIVGDMFCQEVGLLAPFDLVVACEVFYYMSDVLTALQQMHALGRSCLMTYFEGEIHNLDKEVLAFCPNAISETIEFGKGRWRIIMWWSRSANGTKMSARRGRKIHHHDAEGPDAHDL
jgi:SAM-dependent methyltransferase